MAGLATWVPERLPVQPAEDDVYIVTVGGKPAQTLTYKHGRWVTHPSVRVITKEHPLQVRDGEDMIREPGRVTEPESIAAIRSRIWQQTMVLDDWLDGADGERRRLIDDASYYLREAMDSLNALEALE